MANARLSDRYKREYSQVSQRLSNMSIGLHRNLEFFSGVLNKAIREDARDLPSASILNVNDLVLMREDLERLYVLQELIQTLEKEGL